MEILDKLREIDSNITSIEKVLKKKEYEAAGLQVELYVGPEWMIGTFQFGVFSGIETELLQLMLKGLKNSKEQYLKYLQKEYSEIQSYLDKQPQPCQ